jgi:hypothetical protein
MVTSSDHPGDPWIVQRVLEGLCAPLLNLDEETRRWFIIQLDESYKLRRFVFRLSAEIAGLVNPDIISISSVH